MFTKAVMGNFTSTSSPQPEPLIPLQLPSYTETQYGDTSAASERLSDILTVRTLFQPEDLRHLHGFCSKAPWAVHVAEAYARNVYMDMKQLNIYSTLTYQWHLYEMAKRCLLAPTGEHAEQVFIGTCVAYLFHLWTLMLEHDPDPDTWAIREQADELRRKEPKRLAQYLIEVRFQRKEKQHFHPWSSSTLHSRLIDLLERPAPSQGKYAPPQRPWQQQERSDAHAVNARTYAAYAYDTNGSLIQQKWAETQRSTCSLYSLLIYATTPSKTSE